MRGTKIGAAVATVVLAGCLGWGQQSSPPASVAIQAQVQPQTSAEAVPAKEMNRTPKQKLLDNQAQQLVTMAGELKMAVDKTNKNILSMDVIRKAEEIEALARKMKDQGKK